MKAGGLLLLAGAVVALFVATHAKETADTVASAGDVVQAPVTALQSATDAVVAPTIGLVQDAGDVAAEALPEPPATPAGPEVSKPAVDLIVRYEVISPAYYTKKLQGVICPGGASGPTWGIGYDGGHQTKATILREWSMHDAVERLATTAGRTGETACAQSRATLRDIRVPLAMAQMVFTDTSVPTWLRATQRAYPGIHELGLNPEGGMLSNTFNRGTSMLGDRAYEKRVIRDTCIPNRDKACVAAQLRASCRIWKGTKLEAGLCRRRFDEADVTLL